MVEGVGDGVSTEELLEAKTAAADRIQQQVAVDGE